MKYFERIIFILLLHFIFSLPTVAQFHTDEILIPLGNVSLNDNIEFSFEITNDRLGYNAFSIQYQQGAAPWIESITQEPPAVDEGETQIVTVTGVYDGAIGYQWFNLTILDVVGYTSVVQVTLTGIPPIGVEDYILINDSDQEFTELDNLYYEADFIDEYPYGDNITDWNLKIVLFSTTGDYIYQDINKHEWGWTWWNITAPILPDNVTFLRNENGQIDGHYVISGTDDGEYYHYADGYIGIKKTPDKSQFRAKYTSSSSIELQYTNTGGLENFIYYGYQTGAPYSGSGLNEGNSPINNSDNTTIELSGMQPCTEYFFSGIAQNEKGSSNYWDEIRVLMFEAPNQSPVRLYLDDVFLTDVYVGEGNRYFSGNLIIESGAEITFEGGYLYFEENSKIIIEPGGKLILNGATCTAPCGQTWQGIEVWGNTNAHQFTIDGTCAQGQLILQNWASIENAWNAVTLWKPDNWNMTGGIIVANNSTFNNNKRSVEFISYHNYQPISGERMQNLSYFNNCKFTVDEDYVMPSEFETHISMFDVEGIKIKGCEFSNNIPTSQNMGYGIYTLDAGYQIGSYCSTPISPCPPENTTHTIFSNFYSGISAGNSSSINTIYVSEAEFHNNSYGVQLNAVDNATVVFNKFYVGPNVKNASICNLTYGIGIDINNSNGYAIEENEFYSADGMNGEDIGVRVTYNPDPEHHIPDVVYNEIYKNKFNGLKIADAAEGENLNSYEGPFVGLNYLCNQNSNNGYDFYVTGKGIRPHQGDNEKPAGNTFSLNGNNPYSDVNNQAIWDVIYHYDRNAYYEIPQYYNEKVYPIANSNSNTCSSNYGGGNQQQATGMGLTTIQQQYFEQEFYNNRSDYNGTKALYESLIDGGNTPSAITDIETAWPDEMWAIRAELLAMSPHLSADVLMKTADRTDLFPDAVIYEIFSANPDALRDGKLIEYLETKENPLPTYMIDALQSGGGTITYKTILQSELAEYGEKMTNSANIIIRNMLNDSLVNNDSIQSWLVRIHTMAHDYQLIDNYLQNGNPATSISLVNNLPVVYSFEDADTTEYHFYKTLKQLQATIINGERNTFQLTAGEKSGLESIADNSSSRAGTQAKNIMAFVYGNEYTNCPRTPDPVTYKQSEASIYNFAENLLSVEALPNPAKSWTAFNYSYPETAQKGLIQIRDTRGQLVEVIELEKAAGQVIWDTRKVIPGVYLFTLQADAYTKSGKLVVTQ